MGREFLELFEDWANHYDESVNGHDQEYQEVFRNYEHILDTVVERSVGTVLEFGVGTGNLTNKFIQKGFKIYGIEPSEPMRSLALEKLPETVVVTDGDFLEFQWPEQTVNTIVSTYAFHHLTDEEKGAAIAKYGNYLQKGDKIVFADTAFESRKAYEEIVEKSKERGFHNLAEDLLREYYTTLQVLEELFIENGFTVSFMRCNEFVWVMEAVKQ
ncbi:class I SAM-dependent DNA methyltransferase [Bacillus pinisoli]|uniref:class I SAM-dependent DNA methyltransferase n=1 Tax=Bacillus pinisoli TaxID=2901866 RepID=UPI001FF6F46A|nr:class I SAM-dependent methyltransferase [Bacillus pinisoli]